MYGLTRSVLTLIGAAAAGALVWLGASIVSDNGSLTLGEHWATAGLVAAAGLTMALSQLLGGWTKWGWPRVSGNVFLIAFLPVLVAGGWILAAAEPGDHWLGSHARNWSDDLGIGGFVGDMTIMFPAIAFAIGLVFGLTFDTTGPRIRKTGLVAPVTPAPVEREGAAEDVPAPAAVEDGAREPMPATDGMADDRRVHIRQGASPTPPEAEPATGTGEPEER
jgi:hypothetical protein